MRKIEDFGVMESFGMSEITVDDMFDIDAGWCIINICNCNGRNSGGTGDQGSGNGNKGC